MDEKAAETAEELKQSEKPAAATEKADAGTSEAPKAKLGGDVEEEKKDADDDGDEDGADGEDGDGDKKKRKRRPRKKKPKNAPAPRFQDNSELRLLGNW